MLEEEGRCDALIRFGILISLQGSADRQDEGAVKHYAKQYNSLQNHALNSPQERPINQSYIYVKCHFYLVLKE